MDESPTEFTEAVEDLGSGISGLFSGGAENFAPRFADLLESTAARVRSLTVERAASGIRIAALAFPAITFALLAVVFLFMTIHQALAVPLNAWAAYAIEAGLFAVLGAFLWWSRTQDPQQDS